MAGYIEGTGITSPYTKQEYFVGGALVFRHSNEGNFNSDWGIVNLNNEVVISVEFSSD
jgi:hypothetical protein